MSLQVIAELGRAVGAEGLVAGQIVDIKSEGLGDSVGLQTLQVRPLRHAAAGSACFPQSWCVGAGANTTDVLRQLLSSPVLSAVWHAPAAEPQESLPHSCQCLLAQHHTSESLARVVACVTITNSAE